MYHLTNLSHAWDHKSYLGYIYIRSGADGALEVLRN